ncbi:MAG TPA: GntR family transcriptional regulator [Hydrogenophaga sp.]|uniref:GntR family transcriptional regulator n=1 Tax=Hydrogenophaga sp. TaxID=1904254 RepID=UPI002C0A6AFE|nr:GntR family transcriptional regulator [Hydrogenophaga sp.]HSX91882.1 GntR family transcriptional regulator [Hydrogenophaga sp.]
MDKPVTEAPPGAAPVAGGEEPAGAEERRRRHGVHADVCGHIRNLIVHGELASGERINELGLSEALGVSRTPIREALKVLAAEGLVELLPNRGSRVTTPSTDEIVNLFAVIAALERLAVETVTLQASAPALARLRALHDEMLRRYAEGDRDRYFELNHRIHETIIEMADNPQLSRTHADLMTRARRPRFVAITSDGRWDESVKEHELVMSAMELRDARFAGEILFRHVLKTGTAYIQSLAAASKG